MYKDFIVEINSNFSRGTRSIEQLSYMLFRKFGKIFVIQRLGELETLINYQPFESIDFKKLERSIIKSLSNDSGFKRILKSSIYLNGTHRVDFPDRNADLEKIYLLGYLDKLKQENGQLVILYDFYKENQVEPRKLSIEAYQKIQKYKDELGKRGEEFVFNLEAQRLPGMPIKKMSQEDVGAGFDILSFKSPNNVNAENHLMLEVKTFKESYHFFVSNNEYHTHINNVGKHQFVIVQEDQMGELSVYKVIDNLEAFIEVDPSVVTIIPTYKIDLG